jgi:hypothetical protein
MLSSVRWRTGGGCFVNFGLSPLTLEGHAQLVLSEAGWVSQIDFGRPIRQTQGKLRGRPPRSKAAIPSDVLEQPKKI